MYDCLMIWRSWMCKYFQYIKNIPKGGKGYKNSTLQFLALFISHEKARKNTCEKYEKWRNPIYTMHNGEKWHPWHFCCIFYVTFFGNWKFLGKKFSEKNSNFCKWWNQVEKVLPDHFYCIFKWQLSSKWCKMAQFTST